MAGADKQTVAARIDRDTVETIDQIQESEDYEGRSAAMRAIINAGIRERQGVVAQRWRDIALDAAYQLSLLAVVLMVIGFTTGMLTRGRGVAIGLVTVTIAMAPVASLELIRLLNGQTQLGDEYQ